MWDKITYSFPKFNGATVEVWKWISKFIPHFIMDVITHPCWDLSYSMSVKGAQFNNDQRDVPLHFKIPQRHELRREHALVYLITITRLYSAYPTQCPVSDLGNPLQWRHNERDSVSNHQPYDCLLNRLFKAHIKENIKAPRHWPLRRIHRWIPHT